MAIYLVGDIQGCFDELQLLLEKVNFDSAVDQLWPVGDLIGRGRQSLQTLKFLFENKHCVKPVLGNHDLHFLAIYHGFKKAKPSDNLLALLESKKAKPYAKWLEKQPLARRLPDGSFVSHAGLYPLWSVGQALDLAEEVQKLIHKQGIQTLLQSMYGDQPAIWSESLTGEDRYRFIVNALTRMRYLKVGGELELSCKAPINKAPRGVVPWFDFPTKNKHRVIFGHWASILGKTGNSQYVGLDTGCIWGNCLTMLRYNDCLSFSQHALAENSSY